MTRYRSGMPWKVVDTAKTLLLHSPFWPVIPNWLLTVVSVSRLELSGTSSPVRHLPGAPAFRYCCILLSSSQCFRNCGKNVPFGPKEAYCWPQKCDFTIVHQLQASFKREFYRAWGFNVQYEPDRSSDKTFTKMLFTEKHFCQPTWAVHFSFCQWSEVHVSSSTSISIP
jgi:hypothetical protein